MRHHSFSTGMRIIARAAARAERNRLRAQASQQAAMIRALRNAERQAKADAREAAKLHVVAQIEDAEDLSRAVQDREKAIGNLLVRALTKNPRVDLSSMMKTFAPARFDETQWEMLSAPDRDEFAPNRIRKKSAYWSRYWVISHVAWQDVGDVRCAVGMSGATRCSAT